MYYSDLLKGKNKRFKTFNQEHSEYLEERTKFGRKYFPFFDIRRIKKSRAKIDEEQRKIATDFYGAMLQHLRKVKNKYKKEAIKNEGWFELPGGRVDERYKDLLVVFSTRDTFEAGSGVEAFMGELNAKYKSMGYTYMIGVPFLGDPPNIWKGFATKLKKGRFTFLHEFVHYLEISNNEVLTAGDIDDYGTADGYFNNVTEFNAWFQAGMAEFDEFRYDKKISDDEKRMVFAEEFKTFYWNVIGRFFKSWEARLNIKYRKHLERRLKSVHKDILKQFWI